MEVKMIEKLIKMSRSRFDYSIETQIKLRTIFCFLPMLFSEIYASLEYGTDILMRFYYLTTIGAGMCLMTEAMGVYILICDLNKITPTYFLLRLHHMMFECSFVCQYLITLVYWVLLHRDDHKTGYYYNLAIIHHTFPIVVANIALILWRYKFKVTDFKYILTFGLTYTFNNFLQTKLLPRSPYNFLTWEGIESVIAVIILTIIFGSFYLLIWFVLKYITTNEDEKEKIH